MHEDLLIINRMINWMNCTVCTTHYVVSKRDMYVTINMVIIIFLTNTPSIHSACFPLIPTNTWNKFSFPLSLPCRLLLLFIFTTLITTWNISYRFLVDSFPQETVSSRKAGMSRNWENSQWTRRTVPGTGAGGTSGCICGTDKFRKLENSDKRTYIILTPLSRDHITGKYLSNIFLM